MGSDRGSEPADSEKADDTESMHSSSKSSNSSRSDSEVGVCNSSPARSACDEGSHPVSRELQIPTADGPNPFRLSFKMLPRSPTVSPARLKMKNKTGHLGPPKVKLKWGKQSFDLNLDEFSSIGSLREHVEALTGVIPSRQTLILAGRRLPLDDEQAASSGGPSWKELLATIRPGQGLMMVGNPGQLTASRPQEEANEDAAERVQESTVEQEGAGHPVTVESSPA